MSRMSENMIPDSGKTAVNDGERKLSDYALLFDLLSTIAASRNEEEVFNGIASIYKAKPLKNSANRGGSLPYIQL